MDKQREAFEQYWTRDKKRCTGIHSDCYESDETQDAWDLWQAAQKDVAERSDSAIDSLNKIIDWANAYPVMCFPEPDFQRAHEILKQNGISIDSISASNMRHVLNGVVGYVQEAIKQLTDK